MRQFARRLVSLRRGRAFVSLGLGATLSDDGVVGAPADLD